MPEHHRIELEDGENFHEAQRRAFKLYSERCGVNGYDTFSIVDGEFRGTTFIPHNKEGDRLTIGGNFPLVSISGSCAIDEFLTFGPLVSDDDEDVDDD